VTVVVGYTPTPLGRHVLEAAVEEASRRRVDLVLVNSATGASYADRGLAPGAELDRAVADAKAQGVSARVHQAADALAPAQTLLDEAARVSADLIVIGVRSRSRTGKFLLGSTAQTVLLNAPCNVLAVRDTRPAG
jgi:nucleotide-binding universal stress UspA family protein